MSRIQIAVPYGQGQARAEVPAETCLGSFQPVAPSTAPDESRLIGDALANPIGSKPLRELVRPGQSVALVTSDLTRPCPSDRLLPPILEELAAAGVPDDDIFIVMALGLHRPMSAEEIDIALGTEVSGRYRVLNHDPEDTVRLGTTSSGTPVEFFRPLVEADVRICVGNLELHYFAGFSGGAKAILPGCASKACIRANHAKMVDEKAAAMNLDDNPVRNDLEEGVALLGVDFILNAIVDEHHRVVAAYAGDVTLAHRAGCRQVTERGTIPIPAKADIVVVGAGGFPKDINLYQAQKALENAATAVRDGGVVILVAECGEGFGNQTFEDWMMSGDSADETLARIEREFVLGGHKAAAIAAVRKRVDIYTVSAMDGETLARGGLVVFTDLQAALDAAFADLGAQATSLVFPYGASSLPAVASL